MGEHWRVGLLSRGDFTSNSWEKEARCGAVFPGDASKVAHDSRRLLTFHVIYHLHKQGLPTLRVPTALDQRQRTGARLMLVLTLVLRLGALDGDVGNGIPRVVDADEQEQHRNRTDDEQCQRRIAQE